VVSDSEGYGDIAERYGARFVPELEENARDQSPDIAWVRQVVMGPVWRAPWLRFSILRPTSPFRQPATIRRAFAEFDPHRFDSLRAVERCSQHPAKMWTIDEAGGLNPVLTYSRIEHAHSRPYQSLPPVYAQNASLEIARTSCVIVDHSISGRRIQAFFTDGWEGWDINTEQDWWLTLEALRRGDATLPEIGAGGLETATVHPQEAH